LPYSPQIQKNKPATIETASESTRQMLAQDDFLQHRSESHWKKSVADKSLKPQVQGSDCVPLLRHLSSLSPLALVP
jgi:hypothetical protein